MAVMGGKFIFPSDGRGDYTEDFKDLIRGCLKVKSEERWDIDQVSLDELNCGERERSGLLR